MKKYAVFLLLLFFFIVVQTQSLAEEIAPTVEGSEVIITEEKEPSIDVNTLQDSVTTLFAPESADDQNQPRGLSFARGIISCMVMGSDVYCPWTIEVGGDVITYSNVIVFLEKHYGLFQGWKDYSTFSFKHSVNIPTNRLRNEASFRLAPGNYRVKLGGSFITAKNGKYDALANGPFYFTVK